MAGRSGSSRNSGVLEFCKATEQDENLTADSDGVHPSNVDLLQYQRNLRKVWNLFVTVWTTIRKQCHGGKTCHTLLDGVQREVRTQWADDESIEAMSEAEEDARHSISSAATKVRPSAAHSAGGTSSSSGGP